MWSLNNLGQQAPYSHIQAVELKSDANFVEKGELARVPGNKYRI